MSWGVAGGPRRWTWSSLDVEGTYPGNGRVNTPCVQTLQSLGTVTGASHPEIQCRLHNPDIESRVTYMCCGGLYDSGDNEKNCMVSVYKWTAWFLNQISLPLLVVCLSRVVCFPFAMITYSVGADVVTVSKALLEDEESSFKCWEGGFQWEL